MNNYLDVLPSGSVKTNFPHLAPHEMNPALSCALDVAERELARTRDARETRFSYDAIIGQSEAVRGRYRHQLGRGIGRGVGCRAQRAGVATGA